MAKRKTKSLPPLTPRAKEIVTFVVNTVALSTHDDEAEIGAVAKTIGMAPNRLRRPSTCSRPWIRHEQICDLRP